MTRKLLVTIALGAALAIIAAGTATSLTVSGAQVSTPTVGALPECSNLSDDDGDGLVDLADPGCSGPLDTSEYNAPTSGGSGGSGGSGTTTSGGGSTTTTGGSGGSSGGGNSTTTTSGKVTSKVTKKTTATKSPGLFGKQAKKGQGAKQVATAEKQKIEQPTLRNPNGSPANTNPGLTVATFGPAPIGVPNFVIDSFEIPPFLLPIYQSCGTEYGIPWQVLAGINKIETAFGTNLNVSSAGAEGWMQFIPSTWAAYGVDANNDGRKDPYNPVDAICAAARYLRAAGGDTGHPAGDLLLQPRRLVRGRGAALRQPVRQAPRRPGRLAHWAHRGRPLPGRGRRPVCGRHQRRRRAGPLDHPAQGIRQRR